MSQLARSRLKAERDRIVTALESSGSPFTPNVLAECSTELAAIDALSAKLRWEPSPWLLATFLLLAGITVVGGASLVRKSAATFDLSASLSALDFKSGLSQADRSGFSDVVNISGFEVTRAIGDVPKLSSLSSFELDPGSTVTVFQDRPDCVVFGVTGPHQLVLRLAGNVGAKPGSLAPPDVARVSSGGTVHFCTKNENRAAIFLNPETIDISRVQSSTPPEVRTGAINEGRLRIVDTQKTLTLDGLNRLRFDGIRNGSLTIILGRQLRVLMSGIVEKPQSLSGPSGQYLKADDLRPTVLEIYTSSPFWRPFVTALIGAIGALWSGYKFFSRRL